MPTAADILRITGVSPRDMALYTLAFTHKSAVRRGGQSYDRLEFLGDAKLSCVVAHHLFAAYPGADEDFLSRMRNQMVSRECLAGVARQLDLASLIIMNRRGLARGWNHNDRILEDVLEALIAALMLDSGEDAAASFILRCVHDHMNLEEIARRRNYKDVLTRHTQSQGLPPPHYQARLCEDGRMYCAAVEVSDGFGHTVSGEGVAVLKKSAQQLAARACLDGLHTVER